MTRSLPLLPRVIHVKLTDEEYAWVKARAHEEYCTLPAFMRKILGVVSVPDRRGGKRAGAGAKPKKKPMVQAPLFGATDPPAPPESTRRASDSAIAVAAPVELADDERDAGE